MLSKFEQTITHPLNDQRHYLMALRAFQQQDYAKAACLLLEICYRHPDFHSARFKLACAQMKIRYWQGAQTHFEDLLGHKDPDIICNLGICHWQQGQIKRALRYFKYNLIHFPHHVETRENLASVYLQFHRISKAIGHFQDILNFKPHRVDIRFNLAACYQKLGLYQEAIHVYRQILNSRPQDYSSLYNLGIIFYNLKELKGAKHYWQECLKLKPKHQELIFLLKKLEQKSFSQSEYQEFVKHNFDNYASTYNHHLTQTLNYRLPQKLENYAKKKFQAQQFQVGLDLGCGTGLCGPWLKIYSRQLIGVDFSQKMLTQAGKLGVYDDLIHSSIQHFFKTNAKKFDFIILVDVIPYIEELAPLIDQVYAQLNLGGQLFITSEMSPQFPGTLQDNARFAYHPDYIKTLCQSFQLQFITMFEVIAREENKMPVKTGIYHWQKN